MFTNPNLIYYDAFVFCSTARLFVCLRMRMSSSQQYANVYVKSIFMCPRSTAGVPFDSARRFRASLLLLTTCMRLCCNWVASCVAVQQTKNQKKPWQVNKTKQHYSLINTLKLKKKSNTGSIKQSNTPFVGRRAWRWPQSVTEERKKERERERMLARERENAWRTLGLFGAFSTPVGGHHWSLGATFLRSQGDWLLELVSPRIHASPLTLWYVLLNSKGSDWVCRKLEHAPVLRSGTGSWVLSG